MASLQLEKTPAKEAASGASQKWPEGMRVMAVDDDRICLMILEAILQKYKYHVTKVRDAEAALKILREKKGWYDLVITDLHMPEMDGFELLRQIGLEMDLPVIMLSANDDTETVMKGIRYGACDYLVKPIQEEQLKHIWQHVFRRRPEARNHNVADHRVEGRIIAEGEQGARSTCRKNSRNKKNDGRDSNESKQNSSKKKPRVSWSVELHGQFLDAVNKIGIDKAGPKKICDMMNVDHVSRESVGSHLQKYRIFLKRLAKDPKWKPDNDDDGLCDAAERWKMSSMELFEHCHEDRICRRRRRRPSSVGASSSSNNHHFTSQQPIQPFGMGTVSHRGSMPKDASASASATGYGSYAKTLRDILLEANQRRNQFPVQPAAAPVLNHSSAMMNVPTTNQVGALGPLGVGDTSRFPDLAGNYNNTWQTLVPSQFPDLLRRDGTSAGLSQLANVSRINQLASSRQMPMIQNGLQNEMQNVMEASNSNTSSSMVGFNQHVSPFSNVARNTASSFEMLMNGSFAPGGSSSSISVPNIQTRNSISFPSLAHGSTSGISFPNIHTSNSVGFPNLALAGSTSGFSLPNLQATNSISFPSLAHGSTSGINFPNIQASNSVSFPNLALAGSTSAGISFPTLAPVGRTSSGICFPTLAPAGSTSGISFPNFQTSNSISFPNLAHGITSGISFPNSQTSNAVSFPNLAPAGSTPGISFPNLPTGSSVTPTQQMVNAVSMSFPGLQTSTSFTPTQMVNGASISSTLPNTQPGNYITLDQVVNGLKNSSAPPNIEAGSSVAPTQMLNGGDAVPNIQTGNYITLDQIASGLRNSSTPPIIEAGSSVVPGAQMLNGEDAVGILPTQEGIDDLQALDEMLNNDDDFDVDMPEYQNLTIDDVLFNEEWF